MYGSDVYIVSIQFDKFLQTNIALSLDTHWTAKLLFHFMMNSKYKVSAHHICNRAFLSGDKSLW